MAEDKFTAVHGFALTCGALVLASVALIPLWLVWAWSLRILWGWFIVPTFQAPQLSYVQAMGLGITANMFNRISREPKETEEALKYWLGVLIRPFIAVGMGWIITRF